MYTFLCPPGPNIGSFQKLTEAPSRSGAPLPLPSIVFFLRTPPRFYKMEGRKRKGDGVPPHSAGPKKHCVVEGTVATDVLGFDYLDLFYLGFVL